MTSDFRSKTREQRARGRLRVARRRALAALLVGMLGLAGRADDPRFDPTAPAPADGIELVPTDPGRADPGRAEPMARPPWLPHYEIQLELDTCRRAIQARQVVRWTNPSDKPTDRMIFHLYPRHKPDKAQLQVYERILESFRIDPRDAIDKEGRRIEVTAIRSGEAALAHHYDEKFDTLLHVQLPRAVNPGETIEVELDYVMTIPEVQGRFGQFRGVTNLVNWYPLVAYYGKDGWDAPPYVAWHQPWLNEAGNYDVTLTMPNGAGEEVATGGNIVDQTVDANGAKTVRIVGSGLRDFSIITSKRFELTKSEVDGIEIRVLAFPEHRFYAKKSIEYVTECMRQYGAWFGPYPHKTFTVAEAYFGWNGNESSGLVMIDERVFDAPHVGHVYFDHLLSHETLHQWWYATVGTDGYRETFMDEGLVSFLTQERIKEKYGADVQLIDWPTCMRWLPNIGYNDFIHNGYYLFLGRAGQGRTLANLQEMGHVHNLFFLAYDRGSKIFGMLSRRMGEEAFLEFLRTIYAKYQFRILTVADFERELAAFTGQDYSQFFEDWCRTAKITDWKIDKVDCEEETDGYRVTARVSQKREIDEPVKLGYQLEKGEPFIKRITIVPEAGTYANEDWVVTKRDEHEWEVTFHSPKRPHQIVVDPDQEVLDANLANNRWRFQPRVRLTPFYTPLDEVPLVNPLDRPSIVAGPGLIDQEGRLGLRGSLLFANRYRVSPYLAYTGQDAQLVAGIDTQVFNMPLPNVVLGMIYEHTLMTALFNDPWDQGKLYFRWNQLYTTSFIYPNLAYLESYVRFGDNFWPDEDFRPPIIPGVEDYRNIRALGLAYHFNTQMPYWNPEKGFTFDAVYENGFLVAGKGESFNRVWSQVSAVHLLPPGLGYFSDTRLVGRLAGAIGSPNNGEHFRFGGATRFRGQRSEDTEGSAQWIASADWRFPIIDDMDLGLIDNVASWRSLYAAVFYDVGESFLLEQSQGVDHAIGAGFYFRLALFSFVEQLTLRLEYAKSLGTGSQIAWFGLYQAF